VSRPTPSPPPLLWTRRGYLLVGGGAAFLVAAVIVRNPILILIAVPLLVAPAGAAFTSPRPALTVDLDWRAVGESGTVRIVGELRGRPEAAMDDLTVSFDRPNTLSEDFPPRVEWLPGTVRFELGWSSTHTIEETVAPPRVAWRDPMGLVERSAEGTREELALRLYPLEFPRFGSVRLEKPRQLIGRMGTRRLGTTGEFFEIRSATRTEPPRRINWWASARWGRWLANEFEVERKADLIVLVDTRPSALGEAMDERFLGAARSAATGIAGMFLREKARVGYAWFGEYLEAVPLATGRSQSVRIGEAIRSTHRSPVEGISERCAVSLRRHYPPGLTTVLLSSLGGEAACDLVVHLRHRGYRVIVLNPAWSSLMPRQSVLPAREESMSSRLGTLERRMRLATIRAYAPIIDWTDLTSLGEFAYRLEHPIRARA